jgi:hypothetical protein
MSDTATTTDNRIRLQKSKLVLSDLGMPTMVNTVKAEHKTRDGLLLIGTLYGRANGFVERTNLKAGDGDAAVMEGLKGEFVAVPANIGFAEGEGLDEKESGILFIPDAFHNMIAGQLRATKNPETGKFGSVEFAFEAYSTAAKNPAGYSWILRPAMPPTGKHPLADLMATVAKIKAEERKQLAAPKAASRR